MAVRSDIADKRARLAEVRAEAQALAREAEMGERRRAAIGADRVAWDERRNAAATQIATLEARSDEARGEQTELADAPEQFAEQRRALIDEVEAAEEARRAAADRLALAETALAEADHAARAALEATGAAREELARAEERHEGAKRRLADIAHEISEMLEVEPEATASSPKSRRAANCPTSPKSKPRWTGCAASASGLAPSICAPRKSCARSRRSTARLRPSAMTWWKRSSGCGRASRTSTARRASGCSPPSRWSTAISSSCSPKLFGGGTAELQLIEHDDPLEAGLEIVAKPPGKKPQTLSLLSGGEQALTALALIFAVFLTNPAPICVLDEVDAPLDDHNVERFCDLLDEMTRQTDTRFVIITHNPITMARMNRLFGVTMAERGVSQLVSVDLEGAVKMREAV